MDPWGKADYGLKIVEERVENGMCPYIYKAKGIQKAEDLPQVFFGF